MQVPESRCAGTPVPTYRGPVPAAVLGPTLMHEHLFVLSPELDGDYPHPEWDRRAAIATAVATLDSLWELGVRTVVDLTVPGLGRDVLLVGEVAARSRMNLVAATGWYGCGGLPPYFGTHGPGRLVGGGDPLVQMFLRDVRHGIGDSGVRAGMLRVVVDEAGLAPDAVRVLEAAAEVHDACGVPITVHGDPSLRGGLDQLAFLAERGVDPARLVVGHTGDTDDVDYLVRLMDAGATVAFDRFGMTHVGDDDKRVATLVAVLCAGYADRVVLSHGSAVFSRVTPPAWRRAHAPCWTLDHLSRRVVPRLRAVGVSDEQLEQMMVTNPQRLLVGRP
ncbi:phosphotriesterase family protein [Mumia qirimensis]|uniref:phosphotriesterase family protein n=1 Tax=Mumia qirimensis TaxID=3234852 RepID=UPI00351CE8A2